MVKSNNISLINRHINTKNVLEIEVNTISKTYFKKSKSSRISKLKFKTKREFRNKFLKNSSLSILQNIPIKSISNYGYSINKKLKPFLRKNAELALINRIRDFDEDKLGKIIEVKCENYNDFGNKYIFEQGDIGNCYFISALILINNKHPKLLKNIVKKVSDTKYSITFKSRRKQRYGKDTVQKHEIIVDNKIWCYSNKYENDNTPIYLECDNNIFKIIEKAWAVYLSKKFYNKYTYQLLDNGGNIDEVIYALSGLDCDEYKASNLFNKTVYDIIKASYKKGCYITTKAKIDCEYLVNDHVYLVHDIYEPKKKIILLNPHDSNKISRHQSIKINEIKDIIHTFGYIKY